MKIRKVKEGDLKEINKIYLEGVADEIMLQFPKRSRLGIINEFNKSGKKRLIKWKKELKSNKYFWIAAEINDKMVGFAMAEIKNKKEGWLTMIYVDKKFRRKGAGKKLTQERIKWLRKKRIKKVYAGIFVNNKNSINNLKNYGFQIISVKMEKKLK